MRDGRFPIHRAPLDAAIAILGKKWSSSIVDVLRHGPRRFSDVYQLIPLISHKVLIQQLRALEHDGVIVRLVLVQAPRQVSYELSEAGSALLPIIDALNDWAQVHATRSRTST